MSDGFDLAARQICRENTIEGVDLALEKILFQAVVAGNLEIDAICAALDRWKALIADGYFDICIVGESPYGDVDAQIPATEEGKAFMEKLSAVRRLIDADGCIDGARQ